MKKNVIALAVAAAMAAPMAVQAEASVYGKAHISIDSNNVDNSLSGDTTKDNYEVNSRASRVGIKGSEDLGGGLKAVYQMEWQIDMADDNNGDDHIKSRNQFIGLAGGFGTFVAGRHDTPMKMSTGKLDFFADEAGDYNSTVGIRDVRADNAIAYITPNFNGVTIAAAIVPGEQAGSDASDTDEANGLSDATSVAVMYSAGPLYLSAAHEAFSSDLLGRADDSYKQMRLGVGYNVAGFDLAFVYENQDTGTDDGFGDRKLMQVSAKYNMGANAVKAMYGTTDDWSEDDSDESGATSMGIGFDHNFSKNTKAYVQYVTVDQDDQYQSVSDALAGTVAADAGADSTTLSAGMVVKF